MQSDRDAFCWKAHYASLSAHLITRMLLLLYYTKLVQGAVVLIFFRWNSTLMTKCTHTHHYKASCFPSYNIILCRAESCSPEFIRAASLLLYVMCFSASLTIQILCSLSVCVCIYAARGGKVLPSARGQEDPFPHSLGGPHSQNTMTCTRQTGSAH